MATATEKGSGQISNVSRFLKGLEFPAEKQDLLQCARRNQAEREVIDLIQKLDDRQFTNMADVIKVFESYGGQKQAQQVQGRVQGKPVQQHK